MSYIILLLLPINLLIAKLVKEVKTIGSSLKYLNIVLIIVTIIVEFLMYKHEVEPYLKFTFASIVIVSIFQYSIIYKNEEKRKIELNSIEKIQIFMQITVGFLMILLPFLFEKMGWYKEVILFVICLCFGCYIVLGLVYILTGIFYLYKYK